MHADAPGDAIRSFVGREAELEFLTAAAHDPRCRGVLVVGDPGSGKTALMRVFADRLTRSGRAVFHTPLRQYPDAEELFFRLARAVDERRPATTIRPPVHPPSVHPPLYSDSLLSDLGNALSEIEDFHLFLDGLDEFRDPARLTRALGNLVASTPDGIKFYITSRASAELRRLEDARIRVLRLGLLTQAEVMDFVKRVIHEPAWSDPRIRELLLARTGSSPLLLSMLLKFGKELDLTRLLTKPTQDILSDIMRHIHERELKRLNPADHKTLEHLLFIISGYDRQSLSVRFLEMLLGKSALNTVTSSMYLSQQEDRTGSSIEFRHVAFKEFYRNHIAKDFSIDARSLDFGAEEAERDKKLANESIDPPLLGEILRGTKSINPG